MSDNDELAILEKEVIDCIVEAIRPVVHAAVVSAFQKGQSASQKVVAEAARILRSLPGGCPDWAPLIACRESLPVEARPAGGRTRKGQTTAVRNALNAIGRIAEGVTANDLLEYIQKKSGQQEITIQQVRSVLKNLSHMGQARKASRGRYRAAIIVPSPVSNGNGAHLEAAM